MLEKDIEKKVCDYAKKRNFYIRKFTSPAQRAVPDRLFINMHGVVFFIEFKQKGKKPTPLQEHEHKLIRFNGVQVFVVDSVKKGEWVISNTMFNQEPRQVEANWNIFNATVAQGLPDPYDIPNR